MHHTIILMWILGIDAGGTKTHCIIGDEDGNIIANGLSGPANYQVCGEERTEESLRESIEIALKEAGLLLSDIELGIFGMAGADEPCDFNILEPLVKRIMGDIKTRIVHDAWIGLRAAVDENVGIVSICGTGSGHVGRSREGKVVALRNLTYNLGNYGGGSDLVESALHYAFRSNEGTYKKSLLETSMLDVFNVESMEKLCELLREEEITPEQSYNIPIAVFMAAKQEDEVAKMLIEKMGYEEGLYGAGIIRRLGMEEEKMPVVLIGSLFKTKEPILINAYMKAIHEVAPKAYYIISDDAPVIGALGLGIDLIRGDN